METKIKIVNKSKEGIKFKCKGVKNTGFMSWEEFNSHWIFDKDDKNIAYLNEEWTKKYMEVDDLMNDMIVSTMMFNASQSNGNAHNALNSLATLGRNTNRIAEILGCSPMEVKQLLRMKMNGFIDASLKTGVSFGKCHHKMMNNAQISKSKLNESIVTEESTSKDYDKCSIAEMIGRK